MASDLLRRFPFGYWWPSLPDLLEDFPVDLRMPVGEHMLRIEESETDGVYQLKAELPGVDPDKDITISVGDGVLTVQAERAEEKKEKQRSEFRYGSFTRSVRLPAGVREEEVTAVYDQGVLTVRAPIGEAGKPARKVEITRGG
ncbi:Hsp20/alpha crystallin family protein [Streptomyces kaniharaensis]|uniref:Hsp20/alpha crystallin family protein n=1 Tax=Streptomyces kaniharaensis TaxID=212423 RepID=A0A6N7L3L4_9ACTN|nr:Hsp20/alpha crystallin family protein [Streptomyces kaniharaensis]MQS17158.1 Hsp20/alpha crystallin family protein [Streptomyces kaniharaensis]